VNVLRVLLVDDEAPARRRLGRMLAEQPAVEVVGEAENGLEALAQLHRLTPGGMFVDVRMPALDGLAPARTQVALPPLVFVTAHDEFAVEAFEVNAVDYLLKPVRRERLEGALARLRRRAGDEAAAATGQARVFDELLRRQHGAAGSARIVSGQGGVLRFFDARTVTRIWAQDKFSLFRAAGEDHLTEESLVSLEQRLASHGFLRIHRAELVNVAHVVALDVGDRASEVRLSDGHVARVSRRLLPALKTALGL
jgi:DNA-binding LytR/AlgR family response regulator